MTIEQSTPNVVDEARGEVAWQDFQLALAGAGLLLLLIALSPWLWFLQPLRLALGLVYVLFLPGYCLTAALFPRADDIDGIERLGLSLGLSVAWVSLLALILDWLPWGLRLWPIALGELTAMLLFMAAALWRRTRLPAAAVYIPDLAWRPRPWWRALPRFEQRIYTLAAGALLVAGLAAAWVFLVPSPAQYMTEFYMLGAEGLAESYPREAAVGQEIGVTLGVMNRERDARAYRVEVWAVDPWSEGRRQLLAGEGPLVLLIHGFPELATSWEAQIQALAEAGYHVVAPDMRGYG
ncbi:MAG: alpha/beta fold hydrolase, partial [Anaerolinea sp.]|nr:alpha/beta fold hydrolase [Anaerolinea sp.]